jgi:GH18 family chitinase
MNLTVIGYFTSWSIYQRGFKVSLLPVDVIDQVNYAFANIKNGVPVLGDLWADLALGSKSQINFSGKGDRSDRFSKSILKSLPENSNLTSVLQSSTIESELKVSFASSTLTSISTEEVKASNLETMRGNFGELHQLKKKNPNLKTNLSIGGWTWSSNFLPAVQNSTTIKLFVNGVKEMINEYGFDGVDLDWEYPKGPIENLAYLNLTKELREALGPNITISIAVPCCDVKRDLLVGELAKVIDLFNIMSYDYTIAGIDPLTNHHSNLFSSPKRPDESSTDNCIRFFQDQGAKPHQIILGVPFYGRTFKNASSIGAPYDGPGRGSYEVGFIDYRDIKCVDEKFDEDTKAAYCVQTQKATQTLTKTVTQVSTGVTEITEKVTIVSSMTISTDLSSQSLESSPKIESSSPTFVSLSLITSLSGDLAKISNIQSASDSTLPETKILSSSLSEIISTTEIVIPKVSTQTFVTTKIHEETFTIEVDVPCLIVYDSKRALLEKMKYVREKGLAGVMFWETSGDNGDLIKIIGDHKFEN